MNCNEYTLYTVKYGRLIHVHVWSATPPFWNNQLHYCSYNDQFTSCKSPLDLNTAQMFFSEATVAIISCFSYKTSTKRFQLIYGFILEYTELYDVEGMHLTKI